MIYHTLIASKWPIRLFKIKNEMKWKCVSFEKGAPPETEGEERQHERRLIKPTA